jgi:cytochrome P450
MTIAGYRIPAGSTLLVSPWLLQRDPRFFADPLSFRPERWLDGSQAERPKLAYLPFGAGSRMCIGESFAWMEGVLLIATIAQRWRLQLAPGTTIEPQPLATLRPRGGVPVTLVQRFR